MPEQDETKVSAFLEDYKALIDKHKMDFVHYPMWQPDAKGGWHMTVQSQPVSTENMSVPSPFVSEG